MHNGRRTLASCLVLMAICFMSPLMADANMISVDLSGATSGTLIVAPGASFAQTFAGQTVSGTSIVGSPTNPLTLAPSGFLAVAPWNAGLGAGTTNSILPQPGNQAPLSILLDAKADLISWTMGYVDNPSGTLSIDLFDSHGNLVNSLNEVLASGYSRYTLSGLGTFSGLSIFNNNDPAGMRYQDFAYNTVSVPEPLTLLLFGTGLAGIGLLKKKFKS